VSCWSASPEMSSGSSHSEGHCPLMRLLPAQMGRRP
jgi:hypothetical protein